MSLPKDGDPPGETQRIPWLDASPFEKDSKSNGLSRWRKVRNLHDTRCGGKVTLVANQRLHDGLGLPDRFVVKKVPKAQMQGAHAQRWEEMVRAALSMRCPYIVSHLGAWQDTTHFYVVMELCGCDGAHLHQAYELSAAINCGIYSRTDSRCRNTVREMLKAVGSLHSKGLAHPDLRAEQFLISSAGSVKLGGLVPTSSSMCPVSRVSDAKKLDVFKLGRIIVGIFFGQRAPFLSSTMPPLSSAQEASLGDLLARLMHPDASLRPSIEAALAHPWLNISTEDGTEHPSSPTRAGALALGGQ